MPQWHVWCRRRGESDFTKLGEFVNGSTYEDAAAQAEGASGLEDGAAYFVSDTNAVGGKGMLFRAKPSSIGLEAT